MSRRSDRPQQGQRRFDKKVGGRVSGTTRQRAETFLKNNPDMNWSDLVEKSLNFYLDRQEQGTDLLIRLDVLKNEIIEARNDVQKHMEFHLHHIKNDFCFHTERLSIEQITKGEQRYKGFIRALNKRLKTELYSTEIYDATKDVDVRKAAKGIQEGKKPVEAVRGGGESERSGKEHEVGSTDEGKSDESAGKKQRAE